MPTFKRHRRYEDLKFTPKARNLEGSLEQALKEAVDDATLRKIKRVSYSANAATEVMNLLICNCSDKSRNKKMLSHHSSHWSYNGTMQFYIKSYNTFISRFMLTN